MTYVIKFEGEVVWRVMSNHGMTDEEIGEIADIDSLEIVSC